MATTSYGVNDPEAVKLWSRKLFHEALKATWIYKFIGRDSNSVIQRVDDTSKSAGDRVRMTLRHLLNGDGTEGDGTLEGNEEALATATDDIVINQLRHAVRSAGKMSEQRIPFSVREEGRMGLQDWWADRFDTWFFRHAAGRTTNPDSNSVGTTDGRYTGHNTPVAPDANHHIFPSGSSADISISTTTTTAETFGLEMLDIAVEKAQTNDPQIRPIRINGQDKYVCFLHPTQVTWMRTRTDTGQWLDIQKALVQGTGSKSSPIFTGALGEYNGVILHASTRVPLGEDASGTVLTHVRRAIFCGAQAFGLSFGQGYGPSQMSWVEELFDFKNQLGIAAGMISGLKKIRYDGSDFASMVISTQALSKGG